MDMDDDYDYEYSPLVTDIQNTFQYQTDPQLKSQVLVEDLLLNDPYILAVYIQTFCEEDAIQEYDDKMIKSYKTNLYELKTGYLKDGNHCGTNNGYHRDCERCWCE